MKVKSETPSFVYLVVAQIPLSKMSSGASYQFTKALKMVRFDIKWLFIQLKWNMCMPFWRLDNSYYLFLFIQCFLSWMFVPCLYSSCLLCWVNTHPGTEATTSTLTNLENSNNGKTKTCFVFEYLLKICVRNA